MTHSKCSGLFSLTICVCNVDVVHVEACTMCPYCGTLPKSHSMHSAKRRLTGSLPPLSYEPLDYEVNGGIFSATYLRVQVVGNRDLVILVAAGVIRVPVNGERALVLDEHLRQ